MSSQCSGVKVRGRHSLVVFTIPLITTATCVTGCCHSGLVLANHKVRLVGVGLLPHIQIKFMGASFK